MHLAEVSQGVAKRLGFGEPRRSPVQTGAVMTALAYRAEGKLSAEDEVALMSRYGTEEALAEAKAKLLMKLATA